MLDRAKRLKILVEANRRGLNDVMGALDELESGAIHRTNYSILQRAFHTMKHDAHHLQLERLARLCAAAEAIVERAQDQKLGLPLEVLRSAATEVRVATETIAAGGRHRLNTKLLATLEARAKPGRTDSSR